jgi:hypothetical protein
MLRASPAVAQEASNQGRPAPWLFFRQSVGAAYGPLGLLSDTRLQVRTAMHRSDSALFQNTYAGAGGRLLVSPAFVEIGPRLSLAPIDIFDVDVQGSWTGVWKSSSGELPYYHVGGKLDSQRRAIKDTAVAGQRFTLGIAPTLKIKVGPIIAFDSVEVAFLHSIEPPGVDSPYVYEALRDMVVAWDDTVVTHLGSVLYVVKPGTPSPKFAVGAILRHRKAWVSGDGHTATGVVTTFKPGKAPLVPQILATALIYLQDADRTWTPTFQAEASWRFDRPIGGADSPR